MMKNKGFTLIELMVAVAIVGIITAIAIPSYKSYVRKGNRQNAETFLLDCAQRLERHYSAALTYNSASVSTVCVAPTAISSIYNITLTTGTDANGGSTYNLSATATNDQTQDTSCTTLSVDQVGNKAPTTQCW